MSAANLLTTIRTGLIDSTDPGLLTGILIFAFFLFWVVRWQGLRRFGMLGWSFIAGTTITTPLVNLGFFDEMIFSKTFDVSLDWSHFIIELASLGIAGICLRDWWILKKSQDPQKLLVQFPFSGLENGTRPRQSKWFLFLLISIGYVCGTALAFLQSAWPGDQQYFSILHYRILSSGLNFAMVLTLIVYGLCFNSILIVEFLGLKAVLNSARVCERLRQSLPIVQTGVAAIFLAYGATMIYFYYIRFYLRNN